MSESVDCHALGRKGILVDFNWRHSSSIQNNPIEIGDGLSALEGWKIKKS